MSSIIPVVWGFRGGHMPCANVTVRWKAHGGYTVISKCKYSDLLITVGKDVYPLYLYLQNYDDLYFFMAKIPLCMQLFSWRGTNDCDVRVSRLGSHFLGTCCLKTKQSKTPFYTNSSCKEAVKELANHHLNLLMNRSSRDCKDLKERRHEVGWIATSRSFIFLVESENENYSPKCLKIKIQRRW